MVNVQISEKGGQKSDYEFDKPEVTIGRMKGNDIVLPKGNVSKKHARIYDRSGTLMIDDLDSTNGTYVNGRKVTNEHEISGNDTIYIGDFILQVEPERQQSGGPPKAPPQPPGGGDVSQGSPPSAPPEGGGADGQRTGGPSDRAPGSGGSPSGGSGAGPAASSGGGRSTGPGPGGPRAGRTEQGGDGPSALDDAFRGEDSAPGGGSRGASGSDQPGGGSPSPGSSSGRTSGESGGGRSRNSMDRDRPSATAGKRAGGGAPRGDGTAGLSGRSAPDSAPSGPGNAGGSTPSSAPDGRPSTPGSGPSRTDRGDDQSARPSSGLERGPTAEAPEVGDAGGSQRRRGGEQYQKNLRADRAREGAVGQPALPPELESEFDEGFHEAQREVAEALLDELDFDDLPLKYPALRSHRTKYQDVVEEAVEEIDPGDADAEELVDLLVSEVVGLGPLDDLLDDSDIRNVYVNSYDTVVVLRGDDLVVAERAFGHPRFLELAARRIVGSRQPDSVTHRERLDDGTQLHVVHTPVSVDGPAITMRKPPASHSEVDDLVDDDVLSAEMASFLKRAVEAGQSILVAGPTNSGTSKLLEALAREVPDGSRLVVVEESTQLELSQHGVVQLQARENEGFDMEDVLDAAVSMHPERILLDACRGAEAYTWVSSAASGTKGSMASVDGLNASDALGRLASLSLLGSGEIRPRALREQIARAVDLVVTIHRTSDGRLRLRQITEVQGVDLDAYRLNEIFYYRREGTSGAFHPTGYIPLFYEDLRKLGKDVDLDIFRE